MDLQKKGKKVVRREEAAAVDIIQSSKAKGEVEEKPGVNVERVKPAAETNRGKEEGRAES